MIQHRQFELHVLVMLLALFWFGTMAGIARASGKDLAAATLPPEEFPPTASIPRPGIAPLKTEIVTLPLVEQNSGDGMLAPIVESGFLQETPAPGLPEPSPTPTPTPLPPQTGATALPIVIGAAVIFLIIILAWLLVGWRPRRPPEF